MLIERVDAQESRANVGDNWPSAFKSKQQDDWATFTPAGGVHVPQQEPGTNDGGLFVCAAMACLADGASIDQVFSLDAPTLRLQLARILAFGFPR